MKVERPAGAYPIPPEAECVFQGKMFDVYQWEQKLFDGSTATFEKIKRPDTVVVLPVTADKKIIVLDQEQPGRKPFRGFPAGRMDPGEEPVEAAKRELLEETGYEPGEELVLWFATQPVSKVDWAVYVFVARNCHQAAEQDLDAGEKISLNFFDLEEFMEALEDEFYFHEDEMTPRLLRARYEPEKKKEFKKLLGLE